MTGNKTSEMGIKREITGPDFDHHLSPHSLDDLGQSIWLLGIS